MDQWPTFKFLTFKNPNYWGLFEPFEPCENCGIQVTTPRPNVEGMGIDPGLWEKLANSVGEYRLTPHTPSTCRAEKSGIKVNPGVITVRYLTDKEAIELQAAPPLRNYSSDG